jgi:uncharacterized protein (TIGR02266 family)
MFQISTEETFQDGEVVFKEGDPGDWVYTVISGAVELSKKVEYSDVIIDVVPTGGVFGELGFIARTARTATARAVGKTVLGIVDRDFLDEEYSKLSADFRIVLKSMAVRLKKTTDIAFSAPVRRKEPRASKVLSLRFKNEAGLVKAFTQDMSIDGMFIRTANPLSKGELFTLKLTLPETSNTLNIGCEVAWTRDADKGDASLPPGMGIKFAHMSEADQLRLKKVLTKGLV